MFGCTSSLLTSEIRGPGQPEIRTLASSVVYSDNWTRLRRDEIERADGSQGTYAVVERDNFAVIIPAENGGFFLVEEYRYPLGRRCWSFPQGSFPEGEDGHAGGAGPRRTRPGDRAARGAPGAARDAVGEPRLVQPVRRALAGDRADPGPSPTSNRKSLACATSGCRGPSFEAMIRDGRIVDDSSLAGYALLLMAERRGEISLP